MLTTRSMVLRGIMVGILIMVMGIFLTGCGEEDVSRIDPSEFYGSDETYAVPESNGPSELPQVVGPSVPPPRE